jgi:hypothetical protein
MEENLETLEQEVRSTLLSLLSKTVSVHCSCLPNVRELIREAGHSGLSVVAVAQQLIVSVDRERHLSSVQSQYCGGKRLIFLNISRTGISSLKAAARSSGRRSGHGHGWYNASH